MPKSQGQGRRRHWAINFRPALTSFDFTVESKWQDWRVASLEALLSSRRCHLLQGRRLFLDLAFQSKGQDGWAAFVAGAETVIDSRRRRWLLHLAGDPKGQGRWTAPMACTQVVAWFFNLAGGSTGQDRWGTVTTLFEIAIAVGVAQFRHGGNPGPRSRRLHNVGVLPGVSSSK